MKPLIQIWLLGALLLYGFAVADEQPVVVKKYPLPSLQQQAKAAQQQLYANDKPLKVVLPSLKSQVKAAKQQHDLDNPLFTGRVDYHLTAKTKKIAALHRQYEPQFDEAWKWWKKLIVPEYLPADRQSALSAFVGNPKQDDLIGARYLAKDMKIQIIDGRSITLVVSPLDRSKYLVPSFEIRQPTASETWKVPKGFHYDENWELVKDAKPPLDEESVLEYSSFSEQEKCEQYVHAVARELLRFDYQSEWNLVKTQLETRQYSPKKGGYGVIIIQGGRGAGWFPNGTITWWSDGKTVVFDVRKLIQPHSSKFGIRARDIVPREHAFGLLPGDKQKFERFAAHATLDFYKILGDFYNDERIEKYRELRGTNSIKFQPDEKPKEPVIEPNKNAPVN